MNIDNYNKDNCLRNLVQQVMSPAVSTAKVIPVVLTGPINFKLWYSRIEKFITYSRSEWIKYVRNGGVSTTVAGWGLNSMDIDRINGACDQTLYLLIINSVEDNVKDVVEIFYPSNQSAWARDLLECIKAKYSEMKVRWYVDMVSQFKTVQSKGIKE